MCAVFFASRTDGGSFRQSRARSDEPRWTFQARLKIIRPARGDDGALLAPHIVEAGHLSAEPLVRFVAQVQAYCGRAHDASIHPSVRLAQMTGDHKSVDSGHHAEARLESATMGVTPEALRIGRLQQSKSRSPRLLDICPSTRLGSSPVAFGEIQSCFKVAQKCYSQSQDAAQVRPMLAKLDQVFSLMWPELDHFGRM